MSLCPNRVNNPNWQFEYDGCSNVPDNPAGGFLTTFTNEQRTGPCDYHDRCYQTCWTDAKTSAESLLKRLECDVLFLEKALETCAKSLPDPSPGAIQKCNAAALAYAAGLALFGGSAFEQRQNSVCLCCL